MNLELNDAGMTFLVGSFVIVAAEALSYFVFGRDLLRFFRGRVGFADEGPTAAVTTGVFIGLSFALGPLVEDVCHKYDDSNIDWPFNIVYGALHAGAADHAEHNLKGALHHAVLVQKLRAQKPDITGLGHDVFESGIFEKLLGPDRGSRVPRWALHNGPLPPGTKNNPYAGFTDDLNAVFYFAKNRVFTQENYFNELTRIHLRVDFARTIATTSLMIAMLAPVLGIIAIATELRRSRKWRETARRTIVLTLIVAATYGLSYQAYIRESKEFNKRVYGYYDSMIKAARNANNASLALP